MEKIQNVVGSLVQDFESDSILGGDIFHGWNVVLEMVDEMRCNGEGFIIKINFEKAFDWVD